MFRALGWDVARHRGSHIINEAFRQFLGKAPSPVDDETLRRVLREEFHTAN